MRYLALDLSNDSRFLDHLCPLCHIIDMPLLVVDEEKQKTINKYYPQVKVIYIPNDKLSYEMLVKEYDCFFQSTFFQDSLLTYFANLQQKNIRLIYCPHGNSDKGYFSSMFVPIKHQDIILIYGKQMHERLKKLSLRTAHQPYVTTGNYRKFFYHKFQNFYDNIIEKEITSHLNKKKKNILYAPTWNDKEKSSSFFTFVKKALKLKEEFNLIIKPHPFMQEEKSSDYFSLLSMLEQEKDILLLQHFPLIYPLLKVCDGYVGDFSSIGYDFLYFEKPMFFFHWQDSQKRFSSLQHCGIKIKDADDVVFKIKKGLKNWSYQKKKKQLELYNYTFAKKSINAIKNGLLKTVNDI